MADNNDFEILKEYLKTNFNAKIAAGGREIVKRCHICGDSKDQTNAHMYIGLKHDRIVFNCFKCGAKGTVDHKFLRDMGIYDQNILDIGIEQSKLSNNQNVYRGSNDLLTNQRIRTLLNPIYNNEYARKKLVYISERFGHAFNSNDSSRFKIVINLKQFLEFNSIEKFTRAPDMVDLIDKFFVGFLSIDNKYVILRRLVPEGKLPEFIDHRYINYNIFGSEGSKFYCIPNAINILEPVDLYIAEGAFDIISIYLHCAPIGSNAVFLASCGKSYIEVAQDCIIRHGIFVRSMHLYVDGDVPNKSIKSKLVDIDRFVGDIFIHRNEFSGEKDFGVPMNRINDIFTKF